jgi:phosphatidylserine/phosphatidylglycerophosphate/cardiolipin synthase-like enzyme
MHFKSERVGGFTAYAVSGTNTASFAISFEDQAIVGLLGFAVERHDPTENERYYMYGFKVFQSVIANPGQNVVVNTYDHPVQSFVWDDFTVKPGRRYDYWFHPLRGKPKNLDRTAPPIRIGIETELLFTHGPHDVFFNRGVASSQAYSRKFNNKAPDKQPTPEKQQEALDWLSRDLDNAMVAFIEHALPGDTILGCFYEFHYQPILQKLKSAADRGVEIRLILDCKENSSTDKKGLVHEAFPKVVNQESVIAVGLNDSIALWRVNNPEDIQHNKFMVLIKETMATEVWTGSTNLSDGGIHGQTNVGHWVRDAATAKQFEAYWKLLLEDPGSRPGDSRSESIRQRAKFRSAVMALRKVPTQWQDISIGVSSCFSPRSGSEVLNMYASALDSAEVYGGVTLAFGINKAFKGVLLDNTSANSITFLLLEKRDAPRSNSKTPFVPLRATNNVYQAWGSYLKDPVYQWARETNARGLKLNTHVAYIHSKFLLKDPLSADPIVLTGSANFSDASTNDNDENMIFVRGDARVADIYFTEFNRLFNHYYFRSVQESFAGRNENNGNGSADNAASLFLDETSGWLTKYKIGSLRRKRIELYLKMATPKTL